MPTELIDSIIEASVFSKPLGSHDTLYTLQAFCQEEKDSIFKTRIHTVLRRLSLQKRFKTSWELYPDFDHTKTRQRTFDKTAPHDLALKAIVDYPQYFIFLLNYQTIRPSSFYRDRQTLYLIAANSKNPDLIERTISAIEPLDLLKSISVEGHITILQFTT